MLKASYRVMSESLRIPPDTIGVMSSSGFMPARFTVTLPDQINQDLQEWADSEGRPKANLVAFLIERSVRLRYPERYPETNSSESHASSKP
jgi:hypothetical protein